MYMFALHSIFYNADVNVFFGFIHLKYILNVLIFINYSTFSESIKQIYFFSGNWKNEPALSYMFSSRTQHSHK